MEESSLVPLMPGFRFWEGWETERKLWGMGWICIRRNLTPLFLDWPLPSASSWRMNTTGLCLQSSKGQYWQFMWTQRQNSCESHWPVSPWTVNPEETKYVPVGWCKWKCVGKMKIRKGLERESMGKPDIQPTGWHPLCMTWLGAVWSTLKKRKWRESLCTWGK